jgi:Tfp pilus assembly protein PilO
MATNNREKTLTLAALLVIVLLAGDKFVLSPLTKAYNARKATIASLTTRLANGRLLLERENAIRNRWEMIQTNSLPADISTAENMVLTSVDRWAQASRISFTSIKPQWKQFDEEFVTLDCRADASGNMQSVARFLYELESDPMPIKVEEIEITSRNADGQPLSLGVRFSAFMLTGGSK